MPACRVNHTSRPNDLQKARASRVPLSDCFGREVPGTARKTEQCEYAAEKECDHIALAAHSWITFPEPIGVSRSQRRCEDNDPNEWRISNECIKAGVISLEHLWKLYFPVEWHECLLGVPPLLNPTAVALNLTADHRFRVFAPYCIPIFRLVMVEERRQ